MQQQNPSYDTTPFRSGDQLDFPQTPDHMTPSAEYYERQRSIEEETQRALALAAKGGAVSRYNNMHMGIAESSVQGIEVTDQISIEQIASATAYIAAVRRQELAA